MSDSSRRDFLKTSSVAALGATALGALSSGAYAAGEDTVSIGLVGCGGRGTGACAQALKSPGKVRLVAMGDVFRDQLDGSLRNVERNVEKDDTAEIAVAEETKFTGFDAYKQVIDSGIDVVILATPPGFRPMMLEYAVEKGVNVFMEKPVATDAPGVRSVLESARKAKEKGLKIGVGLQRHHQAPYIETIKRIHAGEVGDVRALRVYWNGGGVWDPRKTREECKTEMEYQLRNWYYYNWLCGDHICEQHIHNLDIGNWVMSKDGNLQFPVKANGMGGRQVRIDPKYGEIFDHHAVEYTYADGTVMMSQCRHIRGCWNSVSEAVHCEDGIVNLGGMGRDSFKINRFDGTVAEVKASGKDPYQQEHDDLFGAIREGKEYSEAEYGAMSTMTAILGRMCTYSGKEISMKDALEKGLGIMPPSLEWDAQLPNAPDANGVYAVPVPGVTKVLG
ncbi:MAG: Gfo/Idh/MocA family oxidoreductase [Planctomycetaceae bacterium]|nr:Gfo/Idh/MocA family oxidoreductase [Planctomycetaceae bacterium]